MCTLLARWSGSHNNWSSKQLYKILLGDTGELEQAEGDCQDGTHSLHCLRAAPESARCVGALTPAPQANAPEQAKKPETGGWGQGGVSLLSAQSPGWLPSKNWFFDLSQLGSMNASTPSPVHQSQVIKGHPLGSNCKPGGIGCKSQGWGQVESSPPGDTGSLEHSSRKAWR